MESDKRLHPRFIPDGLQANITIVPQPPDEEIVAQGKIIDMSYTGIKIKLNTPIPANIDSSKIKIVMTMPESRIPVSINGIIKYCTDQSECGLQFTDKNNEQHVDNLMFECIKLCNQSIQS